MPAAAGRPITWRIAGLLAVLLITSLRPGLSQEAKPAKGESTLSRFLRDLGGRADPVKLFTDGARVARFYRLSYEMPRLYAEGKYYEAIPLAEELTRVSAAMMDPRVHKACLNDLGLLYQKIGEYAKAESVYRRSLELDIRNETSSDDAEHATLLNNLADAEHATLLNNLAMLYHRTGELTKAETLYRRALSIQEKLLHKPPGDIASEFARELADWGAEKLQGEVVLTDPHLALASTLHNLACLRDSMGALPEAASLHRQALSVERAKRGRRHPRYALNLNSLGVVYQRMGEYAQAEQLFQQAAAINKAAFGQESPAYALVLGNLALNQLCKGEYIEGEGLFRETIAIQRKALGERHPTYILMLRHSAMLHLALCEHELAGNLAREAAQLDLENAMELLPAFSEAEGLNFLASSNKELVGVLLSCSHGDAETTAAVYGLIWPRRGLVGHMALWRQRAFRQAASSKVGETFAQYQQTRSKLARLMLAPADVDPERIGSVRRRLEDLTAEKESLERQLAAEVPEFRQRWEAARRPHTDLIQKLPPEAVFIDFVEYLHFQFDTDTPGRGGLRVTRSYVAFLLRPSQSALRVELGPAGPIDQAVASWRVEIRGGSSDRSAVRLRQLVWEPLERHLTPYTRVVYLCPDGLLTFVPWGALAGARDQSVLLERYAFAVVPYGPFLLEQFRRSPVANEDGYLLAVGDVSYDATPQTASSESPAHAQIMRDVVQGERRVRWRPLPGTKTEVDAVVLAAAQRSTRTLTDAEAGTSMVLVPLREARWAHLATHGFFADPRFRSALQLDETAFDIRGRLISPWGERRTIAGRNPLVLSGLVFAGANLPRPKDELGLPRDDGGILTAEAIAALPLESLELAVLSACDTALGEVAGGEGVFGLQRAFHLAGARNVLGSLWKVKDHEPVALMRRFYYKLWQENKPPIQALREAQLAIYRHPNQIPALSASRGPDFSETVKLVGGPAQKPPAARAQTRQWAAFVLSGPGK